MRNRKGNQVIEGNPKIKLSDVEDAIRLHYEAQIAKGIIPPGIKTVTGKLAKDVKLHDKSNDKRKSEDGREL